MRNKKGQFIKGNIPPDNRGYHHSEEAKQKIIKGLMGRPCLEETRNKISKANSGKKRSEEQNKRNRDSHIGKVPWIKGKHHSIETRLKISKNRKGKNKGEDSPVWKGGISAGQEKIRGKIEHRLWREAVLSRDSWTCQKCGQQIGELNAHHIKSFAQYPELRTAIKNGITFCKKCHTVFHKKYGKGGK